MRTWFKKCGDRELLWVMISLFGWLVGLSTWRRCSFSSLTRVLSVQPAV